MAELKQNKQRNGKLSLYPLKFDEAVKDLLKIKPEKINKSQDNMRKEGRII